MTYLGSSERAEKGPMPGGTGRGAAMTDKRVEGLLYGIVIWNHESFFHINPVAEAVKMT